MSDSPMCLEMFIYFPDVFNGFLAIRRDSKTLLKCQQSSQSSFPLLRAYYMLGTVMCTLIWSPHSCEVSTIAIGNSTELRKPRFREAGWLSQGDPAHKQKVHPRVQGSLSLSQAHETILPPTHAWSHSRRSEDLPAFDFHNEMKTVLW